MDKRLLITQPHFKSIVGICFASVFFIASCGESSKEPTESSTTAVSKQKNTPKTESNKNEQQKLSLSQSNDLAIEPPDFGAISDVKTKKKVFFEYMYQHVESVNKEVLERRVAIDAILEKSAESFTQQDIAFIDEMSALYLKDHDSSDTLSTAKILQDYIRVIPPSLALAQAANESAWGTSRFATDANNYFGQWCFTKGCGLVPKKRGGGQVHEVRKFKSAEGSVRSYIRNLNTHYTYQELREIRDRLYQKEKLVTGMELAEGLSGYSERGEEYVEELQSMIRVNKLVEFDRQFWESVSQEE